MSLNKEQLKALRRAAQPIKATVQVGKNGFNQSVAHSLEEALVANELVKIHVLQNAPIDVDTAAQEMALHHQAEIVSVLGRMVCLYRKNPEREKRK